MAGTLVQTINGGYARNPIAFGDEPPPLLPVAIKVNYTNVAGNWLFCVVTWRQDSGTLGATTTYPSTVSVCDDEGNFWIPVSGGTPSTLGGGGVLRCSIWMAPAARPAGFVFVCPTGFQAGLSAMVLEFTAAAPWYSVVAQNFANGLTSQTATSTSTAGLFSLGVVAWDSNSASPTITATGWTSAASTSNTNGINTNGDTAEHVYYITTTGSAQSLTIAAGIIDLAAMIITVHGVLDTTSFPYTQGVENWPTLVAEVASLPTLNANPNISLGTTAFWNATNCTIASVTWPQWNSFPAYDTFESGSLQLTPSGSSNFMNASSENEAANPVLQYEATAWVYSPSGYPSLQVGIFWSTLVTGGSFISSTLSTAVAVEAGEWTLLTLPPTFPPATAGAGAVVIQQNAPSGNISTNAVLYIGQGVFQVTDSYEGAHPDQVEWNDISGRVFTQGPVTWTRGIQYEQQSLEAGTMSFYADNNDGLLTYGNVQSALTPTIGDTDVPIRIRAIWPGSLTPYYPLFSGYTDQVIYGWDAGTHRGYAQIEASDAWSRLTQQMLSTAQQEVLQDGPSQYWTCSLNGANLAPNSPTTLQVTPDSQGSQNAVQTFSSSVITLAGDPGVSCWQVTGLTNAFPGGFALTYFPQNLIPIPSTGYTCEFWFSPQTASASQPTAPLVLAACVAAATGLNWVVWIDNTNGITHSQAYITTYVGGGSPTTTQIATFQFLAAANLTFPYYCAVTFTQTTLTVNIVNTAAPVNVSKTVTTSFGASFAGFTFAGLGGPSQNQISGGNVPTTGNGFMNVALYGIALTPFYIPLDRLGAHYHAAFDAFGGESDVMRLARIAGYSGFVPPLAMRGWDLPQFAAAGVADIDVVTAATDTASQIVSAYFSNIAGTTLAGLFVDATGSLQYRRRLDWMTYALSGPSTWVMGDNPAYPINTNTLNQSSSTSPWFAENNATLTSGSLPSAGPLFSPFAGVFTGNGSTANPQIAYGALGVFAGAPVTPGLYYGLSCWVVSPQGWSTGVTLSMTYFTSGFAGISSQTSVQTSLAAGGLTYLSIGAPFRAPATAAWAFLTVEAVGTPASNIQFYVSDVLMTQVPFVASAAAKLAGGTFGTVPEAAYQIDAGLSSDRAQLFNQAIITQYGQTLVSKFSGTSVLFQPSSGVVVQIENVPSVVLRGDVPYTITSYSANTIQALPFYPGLPSIEDEGYWITNTLSVPLFRPDRVTLQPVHTPQSLITGIDGEVGDPVTFRRRPLGAPEIEIATYVNKLTHTVDIGASTWTTQYQLAPFPTGAVLVTDDVIHGVLSGGNIYGW